MNIGRRVENTFSYVLEVLRLDFSRDKEIFEMLYACVNQPYA